MNWLLMDSNSLDLPAIKYVFIPKRTSYLCSSLQFRSPLISVYKFISSTALFLARAKIDFFKNMCN